MRGHPGPPQSGHLSSTQPTVAHCTVFMAQCHSSAPGAGARHTLWQAMVYTGGGSFPLEFPGVASVLPGYRLRWWSASFCPRETRRERNARKTTAVTPREGTWLFCVPTLTRAWCMGVPRCLGGHNLVTCLGCVCLWAPACPCVPGVCRGVQTTPVCAPAPLPMSAASTPWHVASPLCL